MNTEKKTMVKLVGSLAVALALLWIPVSVHAAPTQGDDIVSEMEDGLLASFSLETLWNQLLSVVGVGSSQSPSQGEVPDNPTLGVDPTSTDSLTVEEAPVDDQGDMRATINPDG